MGSGTPEVLNQRSPAQEAKQPQVVPLLAGVPRRLNLGLNVAERTTGCTQVLCGARRWERRSGEHVPGQAHNQRGSGSRSPLCTVSVKAPQGWRAYELPRGQGPCRHLLPRRTCRPAEPTRQVRLKGGSGAGVGAEGCSQGDGWGSSPSAVPCSRDSEAVSHQRGLRVRGGAATASHAAEADGQDARSSGCEDTGHQRRGWKGREPGVCSPEGPQGSSLSTDQHMRAGKSPLEGQCGPPSRRPGSARLETPRGRRAPGGTHGQVALTVPSR